MKKLEYYPHSPKILKEALEKYIQGQMPTIYLEFTGQCSHGRCIYCDSRVGDFYRHELTFEEIKKLISEAKKLGLKWIFVCGLGEPREEKHFFDILKFLKENEIKISFFTNGLAYQKEEIKLLKEYEVNFILKMDTFAEKIFDELLGQKGAAKKIYQFIDQLIQEKFIKVNKDNETNLAFNIVPTKLNLKTIPQVVRFCQKHHIFPSIGELEEAFQAKIHYDKLWVSNEELLWLKKEVEKILGYPYERPLCQGIIAGLHINNTGKVVVDKRTGLSCGWFLQEDPQDIEIGKVRKDNLLDLLHQMNGYRIKKLPEAERLLTHHTPVISAGGGTKPSHWYQKYVETMNKIKENVESNKSNL